MEVPEKIYIDDPTGEFNDSWSIYENNISTEYTRTDVFIEKACELLVNCIEDFMFRRMEIWDEECKRQTLDNLRKALKE